MIQSIIIFISGMVFGGVVVGIKYGDTIYKMFLNQQSLLNEIDILNNEKEHLTIGSGISVN